MHEHIAKSKQSGKEFVIVGEKSILSGIDCWIVVPIENYFSGWYYTGDRSAIWTIPKHKLIVSKNTYKQPDAANDLKDLY